MELVEELSFGIGALQDYREQQKNQLQRTFVSGSTAAAGKVNRGRGKWNIDWFFLLFLLQKFLHT